MRSLPRKKKRSSLQSHFLFLRKNERGAIKLSLILLVVLLLAAVTAITAFMLTGSNQETQRQQHQGSNITKKASEAKPSQKDAVKHKGIAANKRKNDSNNAVDIQQSQSASVVSHPAGQNTKKIIIQDDSTYVKGQTIHIPISAGKQKQFVSVPLQKGSKAKPATGKVNKKKPETTDQMIARARKSLFTVLNIQQGTKDDYTILQGSSFLYNNKGYLITNGHVVEGALSVAIVDQKGKKYTGKVVGFSYNPDLAMVYVPKLAGQKAFPIDQKKTYNVNNKVAAIANHLSLTTTKGKIIGKNLSMLLDSKDPYFYPNMYVTTAATPPGFSGGPLISLSSKKIIGINSLHNLMDSGIGYSLPFNQVNKLVQSWSKKHMTQKEIIALYKNPVPAVKTLKPKKQENKPTKPKIKSVDPGIQKAKPATVQPTEDKKNTAANQQASDDPLKEIEVQGAPTTDTTSSKTITENADEKAREQTDVTKEEPSNTASVINDSEVQESTEAQEETNEVKQTVSSTKALEENKLP